MNSQRRILLPFLCSNALLIKLLSEIPGISIGFWNDKNIPSFALTLTSSSTIFFPLNIISPPVTLYFRITHYSVSECRFTCTVRSHKHMSLPFTNIQIYTTKNLLFFNILLTSLFTSNKLLLIIFHPFTILLFFGIPIGLLGILETLYYDSLPNSILKFKIFIKLRLVHPSGIIAVSSLTSSYRCNSVTLHRRNKKRLQNTLM